MKLKYLLAFYVVWKRAGSLCLSSVIQSRVYIHITVKCSSSEYAFNLLKDSELLCTFINAISKWQINKKLFHHNCTVLLNRITLYFIPVARRGLDDPPPP